MVQLRIFRSRTLAGANALTILIGTATVGMPLVLTLYAQQVLGYSALKFGISSVVLALGATAGAIAGGVARAHAGLHTAATSRTSSSGCSCGPGDRPGLRDRHGRGARWGRRARGRARLGPEQHRLAAGTALGVALVTTVAVSRSQHYLAAHKGANPLAVLAEGYKSAFLACAVLAGIGLALAFLLPRPTAEASVRAPRGRRAPVRRDQRQETHAPPRHPDPR